MTQFPFPLWLVDPSLSPHRLAATGPVDVLVLSAWCGLAAGELEVVARIVHRAFNSTHRLYLMTRHFVWLVPLINLALFLGWGCCWSWRCELGRVGRDGGDRG